MEEKIKIQNTSDGGRLIPSEVEGEAMTPPRWREKLGLHKFKILGGVLGILVFAGGVFGAYRLGQRQVQPTPQPSPIVSPSPTPDITANWKTYTNTKYGYSIQYPDDWAINRGPGNLSDAELSKQRDVDFYSLEATPPGTAMIIYTNELHPTGEKANCQTLNDCIGKVSQGFPGGEIPSGETQNTTFLGEPAVVKIYDRTTESYIQTNYNLFFMKNGDFYHLHFYSPKENYNQNKGTFDLMLSTFRFLEESDEAQIKEVLDEYIPEHSAVKVFETESLKIVGNFAKVTVAPKDVVTDKAMVILEKIEGEWTVIWGPGTAIGETDPILEKIPEGLLR